MTIRASLLAGFLFAFASFSLGTAWADVNITVNNPSFETLPPAGYCCGDGFGGAYTYGQPIPGWSSDNASGQQTIGASDPIFNYVPAGSIFAYSNGGTISQVVGTTVANGTTYTLSVDLGNRGDSTSYDNMGSAALYIFTGGTLLATANATGAQATPGNWSLWTATYTGTALTAGDSIMIALNSTGVQGDYDNVSLTAGSATSATPEPGYYAVVFGLVGLMVAVRVRRAKQRA